MMGRWIFLHDGRLSWRTRLILAALAVAALLAFVPLRVVLGNATGVTAAVVDGPAWSGRIVDLRVGPIPLGTVDAGVRPLPLLFGRGELWLHRPDFSAVIGGGGDSVRLDAVNGSVAPGEAFGLLPVSAVGFSGFSYHADAGRCAEAAGTLSFTLSALSPLMPGDLVLGGKARCDRGALYVPMTGPSGMERLFLRIEPNGTWTAELVLAGLPPEVSAPLLQQGFSARPGGIGATLRGKF